MALGFMMMPAPTGARLGVRSSTVTGSPRSTSSRARLSPPMPPPTTRVSKAIAQAPARSRRRAVAGRASALCIVVDSSQPVQVASKGLAGGGLTGRAAEG